MTPPTYPARPTNGGALECALPKVGEWSFEPKYKGWRALIYVPHGAMYERHRLKRISIESHFTRALMKLRVALEPTMIKWVDAEAMQRCGNTRGTLIVFDAIPEPGMEQATYLERHAWLKAAMEVHQLDELPATDSLLVAPSCPSFGCALSIYRQLPMLNIKFGCDLYEGIVAKRSDKPYPIQLRSPDVKTPFWVKHRFDQ